MMVGAIKILGLGPALVCTILLAADTKQGMIGKPAPAFVSIPCLIAPTLMLD
jgi:hypothetical protein